MPKQAEAQPEGRIPLGQALLDDVFLLLALGLAVPFIFYIAWGLWDLAQVPLFGP